MLGLTILLFTPARVFPLQYLLLQIATERSNAQQQAFLSCSTLDKNECQATGKSILGLPHQSYHGMDQQYFHPSILYA